jgi:flagellar protein FliT
MRKHEPMNIEQTLCLYETVHGITDRMLAAARDRDWDELVRLESACSNQLGILRHCDIAQRLTDEQRGKKVRIIRSILENDRQIRELANPWMAQLSAMMQSTGTERKLSRAYGG